MGAFMTPSEGLNYAAVLDTAADIARALLHLHCNNGAVPPCGPAAGAVRRSVGHMACCFNALMGWSTATHAAADESAGSEQRVNRVGCLYAFPHSGHWFARNLSSSFLLARSMPRSQRLHHHPVLHMDLKARNVLMCSSGMDGRGVVCKVGLAAAAFHAPPGQQIFCMLQRLVERLAGTACPHLWGSIGGGGGSVARTRRLRCMVPRAGGRLRPRAAHGPGGLSHQRLLPGVHKSCAVVNWAPVARKGC